jgi:hypothetical protein
MTPPQPKEGTQKAKALKALKDADSQWVSGTYFLRELFLSQYHARIFELQEDGWVIEASEFVDEDGFKSYRLGRGGQAGIGI